jgi:hypothetical protein
LTRNARPSICQGCFGESCLALHKCAEKLSPRRTSQPASQKSWLSFKSKPFARYLGLYKMTCDRVVLGRGSQGNVSRTVHLLDILLSPLFSYFASITGVDVAHESAQLPSLSIASNPIGPLFEDSTLQPTATLVSPAAVASPPG